MKTVGYCGVAALIVLFFTGCGQTYSPFLMLPQEPLHEHELQVLGGVGGMPTVSESFPSVNAGEVLMMRYGATDALSLQFEEWTNGLPSIVPQGTSLSAIILLSDREAAWKFAAIPRAAVMYSGGNVSGWGGSATLAAWTPAVWGLHPYLAAGLLVGSGRRDYASTTTADGETYTPAPRTIVGWGGELNVGLEYTLFQHISLNAEAAVPLVIMRDDGQYYGNSFWVIGMGAGYHF